MTLATDILVKPAAERADAKADIIQKHIVSLATTTKPLAFEHQGYTVKVSQPKLIKGGFEVWIEGTDAKGNPLKLSNPFQFIHPPILVRNEKGGLVEDLPLLLKIIVVRALDEVTR